VPGGLSDFHQSWNGDTLSFAASAAGQAISGTAQVLADAVRLEIVLPGLLNLIAGKLRGKIEQQGQLLLEKR
jgi:hypothetical protein